MRRLLGSVIRVQREEVGLVVALSALHFLVILAFTLARIARDGFLLTHLRARSLPYVTIALAGFVLLASKGAGLLTRGTSAGRGLSRMALTTGLSLVGFSLWFRVGGAAAAISFYLWTGVYGLLLVSQFWALANEQIDPLQAKRLFGLIGAGGIVGGLAAGASASVVAHTLSSADLLVAIALVHGLTAILGARGLPRGRSSPVTAQAAIDEGLRTALRRPYVRSLTLVFFVGAVASGVLDYQFKLTVQHWSADPRQITSLLGLFYAAQNALGLAAQLGLAGFALARFGPRRVSSGLPVGVLAGSTLTAVLASSTGVFGTRLYEATMRASVARTADEFLFFPLADTTRRPVKRFIDGAVTRSGEAIAALLVLLLNASLGGSVAQLAVLEALLAASWLLLEHRLDRPYAEEMSASLDRMLVGTRSPRTSIEDGGDAARLVPLLDSPDEKHVVYAMDRLVEVAPDALRERRAALLQHRSAAVRFRVVTLPSLGPDDGNNTASGLDAPAGHMDAAQRTLAGRIDDPDPGVRRAAYRSIGLAGQKDAVSLLVARLERPQDRQLAREALIAYGAPIVGRLGDYLVDPETSPRSRREIPRVLAELGSQDAAHSLLRAAGEVSDRTLIQRTLWALNRIRKQDVAVTLPSAVGERHLNDEAQRSWQLLARRGAASGAPDDAGSRLLARALDERLLQCRERLFRRLGLVYPPREMLRAHRGLKSRSARIRAQSTEFLETVLTPGHRALLAPLLVDVSENERAHIAAARLGRSVPVWPELLQELAASHDLWLRTCAVFAIGSLKIPNLGVCADEALSSPDETLRQAAAWARSRMAAPEDVP
jgi:ATP/ADP translocase/HEAT repeat protein